MTDFTVFNKALKLCWVKRLCFTDDAPWKAIPISLLSSVGGTLIFACNYDVKHINLDKSLPKFYNDVITYWQELANNVPKTKSNVLNQIIWNNQFIKIGKKSVFFQNWHQSGIQNVSSLVDEQTICFLPFQSFQQEFHINCNFLQYYGLLSAIPSSWKELLKSQNGNLSSSTPTIESLTCKVIYHLLINRKNLPPPTTDKRLVKCGFDPSQRRKVYSLPFAVTTEVKLSVFQFKLIHNIVSTNSLLYKMKIIDSPTCPFCPDTEQSIVHLFVRCSSAISFWNEFTEWYRAQCKEHSVTAHFSDVSCKSCSMKVNKMFVFAKKKECLIL